MSDVPIEVAVGTPGGAPEAGGVLEELQDMLRAAERVKQAALNCVQPLLRNKGQGVASEALHLVQRCKEFVPESNLQASVVTTAAQRVVKALTVFAERLQEADRQAAYISPADSFGLQGSNPSYAIFKDVYDSFAVVRQLLYGLGAARQHGGTDHVASPDLQREYPTGHEVSAVVLSAAWCDGQGYLPGLEVPTLVVDHTLGMRAPYGNLWVGSNQGMELYVGCSHRARYDMPSYDKGQAVTCAVADAAGRVWTGHVDGTVRMHCLASWHTAQLSTSDGSAKVCAIAVDGQGRCWAGDEAGRIRVFTAVSTPARLTCQQVLQPEPIKDITKAAGHRSLLATRTSSSSIHASSLRDHKGARITALSCISLAVVSAGGDSPCSMCVWDSRSYQKLGSTSVDSFGVVRSFAVVPWGTAPLPVPSSPSQEAFDTRTVPAEQHDSLAVRAAAAHGCDRWRLLSGHNSGQVLLWQISLSMDSRAARHPAAYEALQLLTIIKLAEQPRCGVVGMSVFERVSKLAVVYVNGRLVMLPMPTATNGAVQFSSQQLPQAAGAARTARFLSKLTRRSKPASEKGKPLYVWSPNTACLLVQESNAVAVTSLGELLVVASKGLVTSWTAEEMISKAFPLGASSAANPSAAVQSVTAAHKAYTNATQPAARHHSSSPQSLTGEPAHTKVPVGARDNYEPQTVLGQGTQSATVVYAKHGAAAVCTAPNFMSPEAVAARGLQLDSSVTVVLPQTYMGCKPQQGPAAYDQSIELYGFKQHHIICPSELVLKEVIGSGAEGKVYRGTWTNIDIAAKEYLAIDDDDDEGSGSPSEAAIQKARDALFNEVALLTSLNHPNLVRFCGVCLEPPLVVMEYYRHGSLFGLIEKARKQWMRVMGKPQAKPSDTKFMDYLTWDRRLEMLQDVAAGMCYLHSRKYIYGDLRSPNLFMATDGRIKIGDFGFTKQLPKGRSSTQVKRITHPRWAAPELMTDYQLSFASDVYSFGIVMYELLTWQLPFSDLAKEQVVFQILNGNRPTIPEEALLPPGSSSHAFLAMYVRLMQRCWAADPASRPSFPEIAARLKAMLRWRFVLKQYRDRHQVFWEMKPAGKPPQQQMLELGAGADLVWQSQLAAGAVACKGGMSDNQGYWAKLQSALPGKPPQQLLLELGAGADSVWQSQPAARAVAGEGGMSENQGYPNMVRQSQLAAGAVAGEGGMSENQGYWAKLQLTLPGKPPVPQAAAGGSDSELSWSAPRPVHSGGGCCPGDEEKQPDIDPDVAGLLPLMSKGELEIAPSVCPTSNALLINPQDLDIRQTGGDKQYKAYQGKWLGADVAVLEYLPPLYAVEDATGPPAAWIHALLKEKLEATASRLSRLSHPNLVRFCGYSLDPPMLVTEYYKHGSLFALLLRSRRQAAASGSSRPHSKISEYLTWKRRLQMLQDVLSGLMFLHSQGYLAGQLTSNKLFVGADGKVRLGNHGLSEWLRMENGILPLDEGMAMALARWMAPEVLEYHAVTAASDVYTVGIIMYEMLTWQLPFHGMQRADEVLEHIMQGGRPDVPLPAQLPLDTASASGLQEYLQLMQQCWQQDPGNRPGLGKVVQQLKAIAAQSEVHSPARQSAFPDLPVVKESPAELPKLAALPAIKEEDFSPPSTPPMSCATSAGLLSQFSRSLLLRASEQVQQQQQAGSSDSQEGEGSEKALSAAPEPLLAAAIGLAVGQSLPASSSAAGAMVMRDTDAASVEPAVETEAVGPKTQEGASSSSVMAQPVLFEAAEQLPEAAAALEPPQVVQAQAETLISPPSAATTAASADAGRAGDVIAPTAVANLAGSTSQTPSRSVGNVQEQISLLEQLQPELSGLLMRLAVLYTAYAARSAAMLVQQQAQLLQQYTTVEDQSSSAPQLQGLEQQQQALVLQLQAVQVLLEQQQLQAQLGHSQLFQIVMHFLLLHLALGRWSQDAAGLTVQYGFISSPSSKGAFVVGSMLSAAAFLILWPMLSLSAAATVAAGVFAGCLLWLQQQQQCDQEQYQWQPPDLLESQILQRQVATATAGSVSTQQGSHSFQVYSSLHDIPGSVLVGLQPDACSSSVGYATWPAQSITGGFSAAASDCAVLLHSLPVHRFLAGCQQHGVALASAAPGEDTADDTKVRDQGEPSLEKEFRHSGTGSAVHGDSGPRGVTESQQLELRQHPVLSSSTLSKQQPADTVVELLENLMSHQQAQHEQPGLQHMQLEPDGHTASHSSQGRPGAAAEFGRVVWICLQPPLLLEELPMGSSLAAWLLWQQQLSPVQVRQVSGLGCSEHTSDSGWMPPFSAASWPAVLTWLQQISKALAGMHARGIVHGGLHAGAVYLSKATADTVAALQQPGSSTDASSCSMSGAAVLSLAGPWQHAVTPGCVVDAGLAAPEVQLGSQHPTGSTAVDVYGFGMLMWQLATGWVPQEQQLVVTGPANDLCIYDELSWCALMMDKRKTTFPGAAAADSGGSDALPVGFDYVRHGGLLGGCYVRGELVTSDVWLPVGYKQLMYDCCGSAPEQRPGMAEVCRRAAALNPL